MLKPMNKENAPLLTCLQNTGGSFEILGIIHDKNNQNISILFVQLTLHKAYIYIYATPLYKFSNTPLSF
jgi:hypothetical protein